MLFNSIAFLFFLPVTFALYWSLQGRLRAQNAFLLLASYVFYGWWDWRFLLLIAASSVVDYGVGRGLARTSAPRVRKALLGASLTVNLGALGFFKYFNFFADSLATSFQSLGIQLDYVTLNIVLPVGISFYTFQTLSYTIDVYRGKISPTRDAIGFFAYVSFFPQLVAGPIERASHLLPQFSQPRTFDGDKARDGLSQILWGLFKKVVVADSAGIIVDVIFEGPEGFSSLSLFLGAAFFAMQIYGDFSGYSDIAIGTGRLFGFHLMRNFAFPYFSRDIAEFWRRWHISLSTWFRDYLYIPIGGSRGSRWLGTRNIIVVFLVSGLWHGANWTFVVWGGLNALYLLPLFLLGVNRHNLEIVAHGRRWPTLRECFQVALTFSLTTLAWVFFRADSVTEAVKYLGGIAALDFSKPHRYSSEAALFALFMLIVEWLQREKQHGLASVPGPRWVRWGLYIGLVWAIVEFAGVQREFIYFQF